MKVSSCLKIVAAVTVVASISLYFAYLKKQEERRDAATKNKESFRGGGGGESLHYGGGGTGGGDWTLSGAPVAGFPVASQGAPSCKSDADCGGVKTCGNAGFCM